MTERKLLNWIKARADRGGEDGQAMIELALSLPLLCLLLLGAAELGRVVYASIEVSNAAHAAAQYGASRHSATKDSGGIANAAAADTDLLGSNAVSVTSISTSCTCANTAYTPTSCSDNKTCESNNTAMLTTLTVQTEASLASVFRYPGGQPSYTVHGSASQVVANQ